MSSLDDIERRINERMAEIDRRLGGIVGGGKAAPPSSTGCPRGGLPPPEGVLAPLNPEYTSWERGAQRAVGSEFGLVPQPFDFSYLGCLPARFSAARPAKTFPSRFDLRTERALMPVRDQAPYGTCWAHAALASMESCIMRRTGECPDFSENNLVNLCGFDARKANGFNDGGTADMASAYLLRWNGPVLERDDPYGRPGQSEARLPAWHLQRVRWIPQMRDASDTAGIKEAVQNGGAVWIGYVHDHSPRAYRKDTAAFYLAGEQSSQSGGHAVTIVGWDDAFPASSFAVTPPGNGAWIVRNSWGTGWGDGGYFYVSYHDRTFGRWGLPAYVFDGAEQTTNYDDVFQYDELGLVTSLGDGEHAVAANVFATTRDIDVEAVGSYFLVPGTSYRMSVHVGCSPEDPSSGTPAGDTSGVQEWAGYDTIRLSSPVHVPAGTRFSVVVELTTPGMKRPIPVELAVGPRRTGKAQAMPGQSFFMCDSQWYDMTQLEKTLNFCCKAYVKFCQGGDRAWKRFCNKCGTYTYTESSTGGKCRKCGAWL